jgi:hypothetical protein
LNTLIDPDAPASPEELRRFGELQAGFARLYGEVYEDRNAPRTVLIVPSLDFDADVLTRIHGAHHYEERLLCLLLLLRMPRTQVIYVTSTAIQEPIIDYYLHMLPGIPGLHARRRLTLISCDDASRATLTSKILARPRMLERIRESIAHPAAAHMTCFVVTEQERRLALALGMPIYGCDPRLQHWGSKSGSREAFREAGIELPAGFEGLGDAGDLARALVELKSQRPQLRRAVVKLNEGFSGEGNALFDFSQAPDGAALLPWVRGRLPQLACEARDMTWEQFEGKLREMGGIVEEFIAGDIKQSPSAQLRIDPRGQCAPVSTHEQVLGGASGQIFLGCRFPAAGDYRLAIQERGARVARVLASKGVLGRFAVDFVSVREGAEWRHYAIEINLRKGGTTHPFLMLQFLTDGQYNAETGEFLTPAGDPRWYYASDNLESEHYRGLTPYDLVDIAVMNGLHFHAASSEGVAFHLIGALSEFGKLGVVCIGQSEARAHELYRQTVAVLDRECG